ncbi:MAG: ATP-binding protein [Oscillatoriales cyanobacterium]|nr:MAG: ATP-binding protein [Oscillatoriales cyanobacterium]
MTNVTLGEFFDQLPDTQEYLTLGFSPSAQARKVRWRNYGLSADFLGDYFATFFPGSSSAANQSSGTITDRGDTGSVEPSHADRQETVKACISYVANELIENAIKFSDEQSKMPVTISLYLYESNIILLSRNNTTTERSLHFRDHIQLILENDVDFLYTQRLEQISVDPTNESCLGLISMMADYGVRLGWQFAPSKVHPESVEVSVMAHLVL